MRWPGARQPLLVLLLCLNVALPLIYLSVSRIAISDPATGGWLGDTGSYIHMYDGVPLDSIPKPFRYRILAPYLARLVPPLPASIASLYQITPDKLIKFRFGAVDFLGLTGAAYFTFLLCETLGFAAAECMIASLLFMTGFPVVNFAGLPLTDAVSYFFLVAAIVCVLRDWDLGLLVMVAVGMLAKETTAFVLVPILALELPLAAGNRGLSSVPLRHTSHHPGLELQPRGHARESASDVDVRPQAALDRSGRKHRVRGRVAPGARRGGHADARRQVEGPHAPPGPAGPGCDRGPDPRLREHRPAVLPHVSSGPAPGNASRRAAALRTEAGGDGRDRGAWRWWRRGRGEL
ncbi:MAG: glycosyltransferase family 39 protein [Candidatus Eisenbacteria bacterium]|uniref:Glycosyltransferase family 39 protein n=1 Tax=Eiseniibacteriota bacterium TaxID=2212470 RepID=A0A538SBN2_UNCEI|nr:MAG: glycosyltransferase family 39 protein [Candidatus Eisenbacteria bacterium]